MKHPKISIDDLMKKKAAHSAFTVAERITYQAAMKRNNPMPFWPGERDYEPRKRSR